MKLNFPKKYYFNALREMVVEQNDEELLTFIDHELELLERKSASKSESKKQKEKREQDKVLMDEILNALKETDKPTTVADLVGILSNTNIVITTSKATALLGKLLSEQKVNREKIKGRPYYSVAE